MEGFIVLALFIGYLGTAGLSVWWLFRWIDKKHEEARWKVDKQKGVTHYSDAEEK